MAIPVIAGSTTAVATSASLTLTIPSGVSNDDLLLILVGNDNGKAGEGFIDNTTGWTQHYSYGGGDGAYIGLYSKIADGSNEDSVTINSTDADDMFGWYLHVTGQNATSPVRVLGSAQTGAASSVTITALTTDTNTYSLAFSQTAFDGADATFAETGTGWSMSTPLTQGAGGTGASGVYSTKGIPTASTTTGTSIIGFTISDGYAATQFIIAGNTDLPGTDWEGEAILDITTASCEPTASIDRSGEATLTTTTADLDPTAQLDLGGNLDISGAAIVESTGGKILTGELNISGSATKVWTAGVIRTAIATLAITTAILAADGSRDRYTGAELDGGTTAITAAERSLSSGASLSSSTIIDIYETLEYTMGDIRGLQSAEIIIDTPAVDIEVDGTISTGGGEDEFGEAILTTTTASLDIDAYCIRNADLSWTGSGVLDVDASPDRFADATFTTATGTIEVNAYEIFNAKSTFTTTTATLNSNSFAIRNADIALNGTAILDVDMYSDAFAKLDISGASSLDIDAYEIFNAKTSLYGDTDFEGSGYSLAYAGVLWTTSADIEIDATEIFNAKSNLSGDAIFEASAKADRFADINLDGTAGIAIDGLLDKYSGSTLTTATTTLDVSGEEDKFASISLLPSASLDVDGTTGNQLFGELNISSGATIDPNANVIYEAKLNISASSLTGIDAFAIKSASISLDALADIDIDGTLDLGEADFGQALLSSDAILDIYETIEYTMGDIRQAQFDDSEFTTTAILIVDATEMFSAKINLESATTTYVSFGITYQGELDILSSSDIFIRGSFDGFPEGRVSIGSTSLINIDNTVDRNAFIEIESNATLSINGRNYGLPTGEYNISADSSLDVTSRLIKTASVDMIQLSNLDIRGIADVNAAMSISATTSVISNTALIYEAEIKLSSDTTIYAFGEDATYGCTSLSTDSTMEVLATLDIVGELNISSSTIMASRGFNLGDNIWRHEGISTLNVDTIIMRNAIAYLEQTTKVDFQGAVDIGGQDPFISFYMSVF